MVPHQRSVLLGGRGCGHVRRSLRSHGDQWGKARGFRDPRVPGFWAVACRLLGHREGQGVRVTRMAREGGAEGGQDVAHEGCVCCLCFVFRFDGA